jgi:hypothetical protein
LKIVLLRGVFPEEPFPYSDTLVALTLSNIGISAVELAATLKHCPALRYLQLGESTHRFGYAFTTMPSVDALPYTVVLPALQIAEIFTHQAGTLFDILTCIRFPLACQVSINVEQYNTKRKSMKWWKSPFDKALPRKSILADMLASAHGAEFDLRDCPR